jgi:catechol 2,3-dioxygenase-like lactoylglutathione lyase family enzyme
MLRGFATVNYWADDLEAAKAWYAELLGIDPYFGLPGYYEFRVGDYGHELGLIDSRYAPTSSAPGPGGAVLYWHVDDVAAALERLLSMGRRSTRRSPAAARRGSSPLPWLIPSGTSWASCTTRTTWRSWARSEERDPRRRRA